MSIINSKKYLVVSILGKSLKLSIKYRNNPIIEIDREEEDLILNLPKKYKNMKNINIINMAIEKMYDEIAEQELENSMEKIRKILGFAPEDYKIERMTDSFCKVKNKIIIVNPDIVKYRKKIIETTLIQAFCKTKYRTNSNAYKQNLSDGIEKYEKNKFQLIYNNKFKKLNRKVS